VTFLDWRWQNIWYRRQVWLSRLKAFKFPALVIAIPRMCSKPDAADSRSHYFCIADRADLQKLLLPAALN
jgi:hypothetical protein